MKFTFKNEKPTGRYKAFHNPHYYIKLNKIVCGMIMHSSPNHIRLQVIKDDINEDGNPNCSWKWITLKANFRSVDESKIFLNEHIDEILKRYNLNDKG